MSQQSTDSNDLLFEVRDGIGRATFNRPQARNAFTFEMYERLAQICEQANRDRSITVKCLFSRVPAIKPSHRGPTSTNSARSRRPSMRSNMNPGSTGC